MCNLRSFVHCVPFSLTVVVKTFASASKVNGRGQPIDEDTEVIVSRLFASNETSNGLVTFSSFAEKGRCATKTNEMVR